MVMTLEGCLSHRLVHMKTVCLCIRQLGQTVIFHLSTLSIGQTDLAPPVCLNHEADHVLTSSSAQALAE